MLSMPLLSYDFTWIDRQIEAIQSPRVGISKKSIEAINNPFILYEDSNPKEPQAIQSTSKTQPINFRLDAIINKSAMINGKWYKEKEYILNYKVAKINKKSILLTQKENKILLFIKSNNKEIIISSKRGYLP